MWRCAYFQEIWIPLFFRGYQSFLNFEEFFVLLAIYTCTSTEYTCSNEHSVITTPLSTARKLLWNIVFSIQDTMWRCAYYQEILISLVLGSFFPFEIRDFFFASKDKGIDTGVFMACYALYQIYFVYLCLQVPSHLIIKCIALSINVNSVGYIRYM